MGYWPIIYQIDPSIFPQRLVGQELAEKLGFFPSSQNTLEVSQTAGLEPQTIHGKPLLIHGWVVFMG